MLHLHRKETIRARVLRALPRGVLDEVSNHDMPWRLTRPELERWTLGAWEDDDKHSHHAMTDEIILWIARHIR